MRQVCAVGYSRRAPVRGCYLVQKIERDVEDVLMAKKGKEGILLLNKTCLMTEEAITELIAENIKDNKIRGVTAALLREVLNALNTKSIEFTNDYFDI